MKTSLRSLIACILVGLSLTSIQLLSTEINKEEIKKNLPKILVANNAGTDFYMTFHPCWETGGTGNDIMIYVSSGVRTKVTVEIPGKVKKYIQNTVPNEVISFKLSPGEGQCYRKTDRDRPEKDSVYPGNAVHIYSDDPIICYGVTRYVYTSDGFLVLPVSACGKEYLVASWDDPADEQSQWLTSYTSVVGIYDNTDVKFTMGGNSWSTTASGQKPGESKNYKMNQADVLLVGALGSHSDLTGSHVVASKPVAVISGNFCAYVPTNCGCCDYISEMELPMNSWGTDYHVTQIFERAKNSMIKIFAKEPKTMIYRDSSQIGYIRDVGGTEGNGWLGMRADDGVPRPLTISGDKPIYVVQYNTGQTDDGVVSDPFQMVLTPVELYQKEIVFNTPGLRGGLGFPKNYINLCYEPTQNLTIPDDLEFAEVVGGQFDWKKLKDISPSPGSPFTTSVKGKKYYSKTITLSHDGVYKIKANLPFAAYSYGFSSYDSYGFPASLGFSNTTVLDTIPPDPKWNIRCDGSVNSYGNIVVKDYPEDSTNRSNLGMIYLHTDKSYNYKLNYADFIPGKDRETSWSMDVINKSKDAMAVVTFSDLAGNDTTIIISYISNSIIPSIDTLRFSSKFLDKTISIPFLLTNPTKDEKKITTIQSFNLNNLIIDDDLGNQLKFPIYLKSNDSLKCLAQFKPSQFGNIIDSIKVVYEDTCLGEVKIYCEISIGEAILSTSGGDFGYVLQNRKKTQIIELKNSGGISLYFYRASYPESYLFKTSLDTSIFTNGPIEIKPNSRFTFDVEFSSPAESSTAFEDKMVATTNIATADSIISLKAFSVAGLEVYPGAFSFDILELFKDQSQEISLKNLSKYFQNTIASMEFKSRTDTIYKITDQNNNQLSFPLVIDKNNASKYLIHILATRNGSFSDTLTIKSSWGEIFMIPVTAKVNSSSRISCSDVNLGQVKRYTKKTQSATIINIGSDDLTITNISKPTTGVFSIAYNGTISPSNPLIITAGSSFPFDVSFTAPAESDTPFTDSIFISSNDKDSPLKVRLTAMSVINVDVADENTLGYNVSISPQPVTNSMDVSVSSAEESKISYKLIDSRGSLIQESKDAYYTNRTFTINTSNLANGAYVLQIITKNGIINKKFLIER